MKQLLLNNFGGHLALAMRDRLGLLRSAWSDSESVGMLANDQLATELITKICQPGKVFVDVGAHIGSIISEVLRNCSAAQVIAIEAMPDKAAKLRRAFRNVEIIEGAVGESEGEVSFFVNEAHSGYSSLGRPSEGSKNIREIKVCINRLDSIVTSQEVDAIKIDVEGAELGVMRGGERILSTGRPTIMFESGAIEDDGLGYTKEAMWEYLSSLDYALLIPNRVAHNDDGIAPEVFLDSHLYPRRTTNYFAVAKERRTEIRDRARKILGIKAS